MNATKPMSAWQFAAFRIVFGAYLFVHFVQLVPWAGELFSGEGLLPDARLNFTAGYLPNPLEHFTSAAFAKGFVEALAALSALFALGIARRSCAVLLWYGWACLFNRDNLISNPGIPFVGLMLLLCALVPAGEPLAPGRWRDESWRMPATIFWGAWLLLAAGYTYSGAWKLFSPSWLDGSALRHLLDNPLARPGVVRGAMLLLPDGALRVLTWLALAGELLALPLSLTRRGRCIAWMAMLAMHVGIMFVVDFADLTLGMVMAHLFTFDPEWIPAKRTQSPLVLFDGECGLCDRTVNFLLAEDSAGALRFAPLQGSTAALLLKLHGLDAAPLRSLVVVERTGEPGERVWVKSCAVARAFIAVGGFWRVAGEALRFVPIKVRDAGYDFIAARRHEWFPPKCRVGSNKDAARCLP
jgi:predicted DCC family thiol-disulfide oxidoreductase YuxK